jgi:uncharacterized protein (DUF849 family)
MFGSLDEKGTTWFSFGVGRQQFPMVAQAVLLGGNVRRRGRSRGW